MQVIVRRGFVIAASAGLLLAVWAAWAQGRFELLFKFEPNAASTLVLNGQVRGDGTLTEHKPNGGGMEKRQYELAFEVEASLPVKVNEVKQDGSASMQIKLSKLKADGNVVEDKTSREVKLSVEEGRARFQLGEESFDSEGTALEEIIRETLNTPWVLTVDKYGKPLDLKGWEWMKLLMPDLDLTKAAKQQPGWLPEGSIGVGDSWQRTFKLSLPVLNRTIEVPTKFILLKLDERKGQKAALILPHGECSLENADVKFTVPGEVQPSKGKVESLTLSMDGIIWFAPESGSILELSLVVDTKLKGSRELPMKSRQALEAHVTLSLNSEFRP